MLQFDPVRLGIGIEADGVDDITSRQPCSGDPVTSIHEPAIRRQDHRAGKIRLLDPP